MIETGKPKLVRFDMRRRFGCNGEIEIFIERLAERFYSRSCAAFGITPQLYRPNKFPEHTEQARIRGLLKSENQSRQICFISESIRPIQLIVIGGGHDALPFRPLCELLGWRLIEAESIADAPQNLDAWTAAIVKTHNYGRDFSALQKLVPLGLRYLGLIGPRRRRDQLLADLFDITGPIDAELFAPAGLDLGAETPEEIALAIVAEIQSVFAAASVESLRNRKAPIHAINYSLMEDVRATIS